MNRLDKSRLVPAQLAYYDFDRSSGKSIKKRRKGEPERKNYISFTSSTAFFFFFEPLTDFFFGGMSLKFDAHKNDSEARKIPRRLVPLFCNRKVLFSHD